MKKLIPLIACLLFFGCIVAQSPYLFKDINTSVDPNSYPRSLTEYNGKFYFSANDSVHGNELWVSDGTVGGTQLFMDIDSTGGDSDPRNFFIHMGRLYFMANDGTHGNELWTTDGSVANTYMVKEIMPDVVAFVQEMVSYNGKLYFNMIVNLKDQLWVTDGTEAGTHELDPAIEAPFNMLVYNNKLFFKCRYNGAMLNSLCSTDGTPTGTNIIAQVEVPLAGIYEPTEGTYAVINNRLLFWGSDSVNGTELWVSDGTTGGTHILVDLNPGLGSSAPLSFDVIGNKLYFSAYENANSIQPWVTDGTSQNTVNLGLFFVGPSYAVDFTEFNNKVYFSHGGYLWHTDGTPAGTDTVSTIIYAPAGLLATNDKLFFSVNIQGLATLAYMNTAENIVELWDNNYSPRGVTFLPMLAFNDKLFFSAEDAFGTTGIELWALDSVNLATGIDEHVAHAISSLYPNPNNGVFTAVLHDVQIQDVEIMTSNGEKVAAEATIAADSIQVTIKNKVPGLYFLQLHHKNGDISNKRFIIIE